MEKACLVVFTDETFTSCPTFLPLGTKYRITKTTTKVTNKRQAYTLYIDGRISLLSIVNPIQLKRFTKKNRTPPCRWKFCLIVDVIPFSGLLSYLATTAPLYFSAMKVLISSDLSTSISASISGVVPTSLLMTKMLA